jgi:hypothetical protein
MPYTLIQHRDSFQRALARQQPGDTQANTIKVRLAAFRRDAHEGPRPPSNPLSEIRFRRAVASIREGPMDLLSDLSALWFDSTISLFTDAALGLLAEALVTKYTTVDAAIPTARRPLKRTLADAERVD